MPIANCQIEVGGRTGREYWGFLKSHLKRAHRLLGSRLRELSVAVVGDAVMSELHNRFMGIGKPTDVLSFELELDARGRVVAGEVVICLPEAIRRTRRRGAAVRRELLLYAVHGMLHLSGFDDRTGREYRKMHIMEDRILTQLGMGPIFAEGADNPVLAVRHSRPRGKRC